MSCINNIWRRRINMLISGCDALRLNFLIICERKFAKSTANLKKSRIFANRNE